MMRLLAGSAFGTRAPTPTFSPTLYVAVEMAPGASLELPPEHEERGVYVIDGELTVGDTSVPAHHLPAKDQPQDQALLLVQQGT